MAKKKTSTRQAAVKTTNGNEREALAEASAQIAEMACLCGMTTVEKSVQAGVFPDFTNEDPRDLLDARERLLEAADEGRAYEAALRGMEYGMAVMSVINGLRGHLEGGLRHFMASKARNGRANKTNRKREAVRAAALKLTHKGITAASKSLANEFGIGQSTSRVWIQDLFPPAKKRSTE